MVGGTFRSIAKQDKTCIACGKILQDEEKVYQISEGVIQNMTPSFLPTYTIGFVDQTCFKDILDHLNETLLNKKSELQPLIVKQ